MAKNRLSDLRDHLFDALESLRDKDEPMDIQRAVAVSQVANAIINSAKLELRAVEVLGVEGDAFFGQLPAARARTGTALPASGTPNHLSKKGEGR